MTTFLQLRVVRLLRQAIYLSNFLANLLLFFLGRLRGDPIKLLLLLFVHLTIILKNLEEDLSRYEHLKQGLDFAGALVFSLTLGPIRHSLLVAAAQLLNENSG